MRVKVLLAAEVVLMAPSARGQETRGQIIGRVTDASGAVVAGASVRGVNIATNVASSATTNHTGDYLLPFLIPGTYNVAVEMQGFRRFEQHGIVVQVDDKVTINVTLEIGAATESVKVVADSQLIDTADASMSQVVSEKSVVELPLKDGNPLMLADLSPGIMNLSSGGMTRPFDNGNTSSMTINGGRTGTNEYRIDGAPNTSGGSGNVAFIPPPGVVSEVKVQTSPFDASTGFSTGGNINVSLKSGTNQLHGQTYYFVQHPALNANSFFSNMSALPKDNYRQNRWGINANGPVVIPRLVNGRNRTFWMYGYEGIHDSLPVSGKSPLYSIPTPAERQGDFSGLLAAGNQYVIYDPLTATPTSSTHYQRQQFPGNIIPPSRIDRTAQNILNRYFPAANLPGLADGKNNYLTPLLEKNRFMSHIFRVDEVITDKNRLFVRGSLNNRYQNYEERFNGGAGYNYWRNNRGFGIDDVHVFNPRLLLNVRYNYTRYIEATDPFSLGLNLAGLGFSQIFVNQIRGVDRRALMLPDINITGYPELNAENRSRSANDIHALAFAFTRIANSHTLNFGGEYRVYRDTKFNMGRSSGKLDFGTNWTKGPNDNSGASPLGQGLASFLLGLPTGGYYDINASYAQQYQISGWYFQDAWKVTSRLTVNLGLRWEIEAPTTERYNRGIRGFDYMTPLAIAGPVQASYTRNPIPQIAPQDFLVRGGPTFAGVDGIPRTMWESNKHNFEPRIAIAWQLDRRTVIRAGYGIFYDIARQTVDQTGFSRQTSLVATLNSGQTFVDSLDNPFPNGFLQPAGGSLRVMTNAGQNINPKNPHLLDPYMQRWQLSTQRRIGQQALFEIAYVGNRATHLRVTRNSLDSVPRAYLSSLPYRDNAVNGMLTANVPNPYYPLLPGTNLQGQTVQVEQLLRPYSQFTGGSTTSNEGFSWFHSLQTRLERRFSAGYLLTGAWTWSKFMEAREFLNNTDAAPTHCISDQDRTHRMAGSAIYELPLGRGKRWAQSWRGIAGQAVSGWQVQGIYQWQSGPPLGFGDVPFYGLYSDIPLPADQRSVSQWFNVNAGFDHKSGDAFVYHIRTFPLRMSGLRGMGLNMWDLSAIKNTRAGERARAQFRAEFMNALNHTHFGTPSMDPTSSDFGRVTSTAQLPRAIQFGMKVIY